MFKIMIIELGSNPSHSNINAHVDNHKQFITKYKFRTYDFDFKIFRGTNSALLTNTSLNI